MKEHDRIITPTALEGDELLPGLRPKTLAEYIGQDKVKENLILWRKPLKPTG